MFSLQHPLLHLPHFSQSVLEEQALVDNFPHASQAEADCRTQPHRFFSSRQRLSATSSRSSPACTPGYSNGRVPSRLRAVWMPRAKSSNTFNCSASAPSAAPRSPLSCLRTTLIFSPTRL